jgi:cytosine/adenosine deaminase-related metal-dependent hydrolase
VERIVRNVHVLDLDVPGLVRGPVDLYVRDSRIGQIRDVVSDRSEGSAEMERRAADESTAGGAEVIEGSGLLAMPGLVNAHLHSTGRLARGMVPNLPLEIFMLWEVPLNGAVVLPPEVHRIRTLLGAAEMLRAGTTSVFDDPILVPAEDAVVDSIMDAYRESGMRATVGLYHPNRPPSSWVPFLAELLPDDLRRLMDSGAGWKKSETEFLALNDRFLDRWDGREGGRLRGACSCSSPTRCTDEYLERLHARAVDHDTPFVVHLYESKAQRVAGQIRFGGSVVRHLRDLGVLTPRTVAVHAVWIDATEARELASERATVVHSPAGNLRCGSGVMPWQLLASAGVPIALCTDEATVEESSNLWNTARLVGMLHTLGSPDPDEWPSEVEILRAMTIGGARTMGLADEVGTVREGRLADLVFLEHPTEGSELDATVARRLVYGDTASLVRMVMVAGEVIVRNGRILTIDEDALREQAAEAVSRSMRADGEMASSVERLRPYVEEAYRRCAAVDVGFTRWMSSDAPSPR